MATLAQCVGFTLIHLLVSRRDPSADNATTWKHHGMRAIFFNDG
jgi:hypothetical protein